MGDFDGGREGLKKGGCILLHTVTKLAMHFQCVLFSLPFLTIMQRIIEIKIEDDTIGLCLHKLGTLLCYCGGYVFLSFEAVGGFFFGNDCDVD